jgi:2-methylcitrate dehydratase PrpD
MLVDGSVGLDTYEPAAIAEERVLAFADRIEATVAERGEERGPFFTSLTATLADGRSLHADVPHPDGTPGHPLDRDAVLAKFHANADPVLGATRAAELAAAALALEDLPAGELDRLTPDPMETD